jgi:hypothetical protein
MDDAKTEAVDVSVSGTVESIIATSTTRRQS